MPNGEGCRYGEALKENIQGQINVLNGRIDNVEQDVADIVERLQNRPSWPVAILIMILSNLCVGLAVAFFTG